uniref:Uncharacterized protein n=1 Tax=Siphoviridae sp. ct4085 TaxID=2827774 RepID=A0A8S5SEY8_9CAUD|nr:MAG TPA: hypothetical protein [Siphoviridae sp. ct4085]
MFGNLILMHYVCSALLLQRQTDSLPTFCQAFFVSCKVVL